MGILITLFLGVFLIFLPLGQLIRIPVGNGLTIVGLDVAVSITALVWLVQKILQKQKPTFLLRPVLLFLGIGLVSLLANIFWLKGAEVFISFLYLFRLSAYVAFLWIAKDAAKKSPCLMKNVLCIGGGIVMALGLLQYALYPSLHPYLYLGWDDHFYRVFSTFLDPNFVGAFLVLYFFYVISLFLENFQHKQKRIFFLFFSLLTLIAVFLTYSRSAYVMLGIGSILFLWNWGLRKFILAAIGIFILIIVALGVFHRYGEGNNLLRTVSIESRLGSMSTAFTIFTKEPLLGVGFDSYRYAQRKYGFLPGNAWEITHAGAGTSNSFLFVLATTGILGLGAYLFLLYSLFQQSKRVTKKVWSIMLGISLLSLCVNALFENTLFYPAVMLWIFTLFGVIG